MAKARIELRVEGLGYLLTNDNGDCFATVGSQWTGFPRRHVFFEGELLPVRSADDFFSEGSVALCPASLVRVCQLCFKRSEIRTIVFESLSSLREVPASGFFTVCFCR
jgi:hypothetical protein